jgi:hypothetical protein
MDGEDVRKSAAELSFSPPIPALDPTPLLLFLPSSSPLLSSPSPLPLSQEISLTPFFFSQSFFSLEFFFFFFFFFFSISWFVCLFFYFFFLKKKIPIAPALGVCGLAAAVWRRIFVAHHAGALCSSARVGSQW